MPRIFVVDAGGTSRLIKRIFVVDSGGVSRLIKRAFYVDSGGVSRLVFVAAQIIPASLSALATYPATATCTIAFSTTGAETIQTNQIPLPQTLGQWAYPPTSGYQLMATLQSGTAPTTGTLNAWLPATSNRAWSLTAVRATLNCSLLIQISNNSSSVIASGVVTMTSAVEGGGT